jgi:hypothetical protein
MKMKAACIVTASLAASLLTAYAAPKDDLLKAIASLGEAANYTWKSTLENSQFNASPTVGKIDKNGLAVVSRTMRDTPVLSVYQGDKAATQTQDGWRSLAELEANQEEGRGRWTAMMLRNFQSAAEEAKYLVENASDLSVSDGAYGGKLTEDGAKTMASFRRGRRGGAADGQAPEVSGASGTARFWVENGQLKKYEYTVKGTISFGGQDRDVDRTMVVEISDVGSTKVEVPEGAKAKL